MLHCFCALQFHLLLCLRLLFTWRTDLFDICFWIWEMTVKFPREFVFWNILSSILWPAYQFLAKWIPKKWDPSKFEFEIEFQLIRKQMLKKQTLWTTKKLNKWKTLFEWFKSLTEADTFMFLLQNPCHVVYFCNLKKGAFIIHISKNWVLQFLQPQRSELSFPFGNWNMFQVNVKIV